MEYLSRDYESNVQRFNDLLGTERCFDMIARDLCIGNRRARIWTIDGYGDDEVIERMISFWLSLPGVPNAETMQDFIAHYVTFSEVNAEKDVEKAITSVFLGKLLLLVEGYDACALIEGHRVSEKSHADVVICYLENKVDRDLLEEIRRKVDAIDARSISMSQESVAESMMKPQWWNPLPKVRYTERPDTATACIMEGDIVVLVDNSPAAMLLPTHFFDFVQEANDFYFPPLVGTYLRVLRYVVFVLTLFITPVWYLLVKDPSRTEEGLHFLAIAGDYEVPLLAQLLLAEFIVDLLKLASLNTPSVFSNSFSMIGALVLGDFAVQAHWLVPEVLAYMAFVAIANFAQPSYELGYSFKLLRLMLLLLVGVGDWIGFVVGCLIIVLLLATTKPIAGKGYLYPLCPFNGKKMLSLLIRRPIGRDNT